MNYLTRTKNCGAASLGSPADFVWPLLACSETGPRSYGLGRWVVNATILLLFLADFSWVFFVAIFVNLLGLGLPSWATHIYIAHLVPNSRSNRYGVTY